MFVLLAREALPCLVLGVTGDVDAVKDGLLQCYAVFDRLFAHHRRKNVLIQGYLRGLFHHHHFLLLVLLELIVASGVGLLFFSGAAFS